MKYVKVRRVVFLDSSNTKNVITQGRNSLHVSYDDRDVDCKTPLYIHSDVLRIKPNEFIEINPIN